MEHLTIVNEVAALLLSRVRTLLFLSPSRIEDILAKLLPPSPLLSLRRTLQRFRASLVGPAMELANLLGIVSRKLISAPRVTPAAQWLASYKDWSRSVSNRTAPLPGIDSPWTPQIVANGIQLPLPRGVVVAATSAMAVYVAYKVFRVRMWAERWMKRNDEIVASKQRTDFLRAEYEEVQSAMEELGRRALKDRMEDLILKDVITPEIVEEGKVVQKEVSQYLIKEYGRFVRHLVAFAKVEFNGIPKNTEANQLAVWRFMYRVCEKRGLNALDANRALSSALPFVFLPSHYDQDMAITMNCESTVQSLKRYKAAFAQASPLHKLLENPLSGAAWKEWANSILYGDQETGLHFAK
jgi:hypothetical protein